MNKRLFIAINLEKPVKQEIERIIQELKRQNSRADIKWVETDNLHLTLHFLGHLDESFIESIKKAIQDSAGQLNRINYQLSEIGCFPNINRPRVLFISLKSPDLMKLSHFQTILGQKLADLSLEVDNRPWQAHITFGRVKDYNRAKLCLQSQIEPIMGQIKAIDLMESQLLRAGPMYEVIFSNPLE